MPFQKKKKRKEREKFFAYHNILPLQNKHFSFLVFFRIMKNNRDILNARF